MDTSTLHAFTVDFYLNETTVAEAAANGDSDVADLVASRPDAPAIFCRMRRSAVTRPGDRLRLVHTATIQAEHTEQAREFAFGIGNGAGEEADSEAYYANRVRSLSVGDVVVVHTPDGPGAYACDPYGWSDVDLRDLKIED